MSGLTPEQASEALGGLDVPGSLAETLERITFTAEGGIKRRTPVRSGALRRSVNGQVRSAVESVVGTNLIYARPVHRGNPFIERGLDDVEAEIDRILAEGGAAIWSRLQ
jgi:hypothetical protein